MGGQGGRRIVHTDATHTIISPKRNEKLEITLVKLVISKNEKYEALVAV